MASQENKEVKACFSELDNRLPIESQLFDWEDMESVNLGRSMFYNCTLKVDMSPYKSGDTMESIAVSLDMSCLFIYKTLNDNPVIKKLKISIED